MLSYCDRLQLHNSTSSISLIKNLPTLLKPAAMACMRGQVRLWRVERSQKDILAWMRSAGAGLDPRGDQLFAYWKFDDPEMCAPLSPAPAYPSSAYLLLSSARAQVIPCPLGRTYILQRRSASDC